MKKFSIFILGIVLGIAIAGASVYFWLQRENIKTITELRTQILVLEKEPTTRPEPSPNPPTNNAETSIVPAPSNLNWKLVKGDPNDTCSMPTFEGNVSIRGWYFYVEDGYAMGWNFNVVSEDVAKLPLGNIAITAEASWWNKQVRIVDATPDLEENLKKATEQNPVSVTLKGYSAYCEGNPIVSLNGVDALK